MIKKKNFDLIKWSKTGGALKVLIIVFAVVLAVAFVIAGAVISSPKNKLKLAVGRLAKSVVSLQWGNEFMDKIGAVSHSSDTDIDIDSDYINFGGVIQTAYDTNANEGAIEFSFMNLLDAGLYIREDQIAVTNLYEDNLYVYDFNSDESFEGNIRLIDHINILFNPGMKTNEELSKRAENKLFEYGNLAINLMPSDNMSKTKETFDFYGQPKKLNGVEFSFDNEEFANYIKSILEKMKDDDELEALINDYIDYLNKSYKVYSSGMDQDHVDLNDLIDDAIDELEYLEDSGDFDLEFSLFYGNMTLKACMMKLEGDGEEVEFTTAFEINKNDYSLTYDLSTDFEYRGNVSLTAEAYRKDGSQHVAFVMNDGYSGDIELNLDILKESGDSYTIEGELKFSDWSDYRITLEGQSDKKGKVRTLVLEMEVKEDRDLLLRADLEAEFEEVRKNTEYTFKCDINLKADGESIDVSIENTTEFGKSIESDVPLWSKSNDHYLDDIFYFQNALFEILRDLGL